ncbi:MAG: universal stress protein [Aquificaceae bacterium]|nr:universal stress protein [Aquificaceae bacterium]MDW8032013.1 universal stress protein [Aquificaceae bacterium]
MKFLVPVDFTEITNPLLKLVKNLATAHQAEVTLLHTLSPVLYLPYPESFGMNAIDLQILTELQESKKEEAKEKLKGLRDFLKPLKTDMLVEVGEPAEVILEQEKAFDLLFMGSHKKGLVERILLGSTTEKVVKYSHRPVFVLKGKELLDIRRVLIAYDFSEHAQRAMEFAERLFKPFLPRMTILHVEETIELPVVEGIKDVLSQRYREEKIKHLKDMEKGLRDRGFEAEFYLLEGRSPVEGIKVFLKENQDIDLVVLGSKGLSGLKRVLLGSTSSELVRALDLSLLIHRGEG